MKKAPFQKEVGLTGADGFILALERHDKSKDGGNNTCRYIIDLEGELTADKLKIDLSKNSIINWLSHFHISDSVFSKKWSFSETVSIPIFELDSEEEYPIEVFSKQINKTNPPLLYFDIVKRNNGTTRLILSWHHLLMDGYGAVLLLKSLGGVLGELKEPQVSPSGKNKFVQAVKSKFFVGKSAKGKVSDVIEQSSEKSEQKIKTITFSVEQSDKIKKRAIKAGARFGLSSFYLSYLSIAIKNILAKRGESDVSLWVPVPQNARKVGATAPIIGNHLSFLFYRLLSKDLTSVESGVVSLNKQMIHQIKEDLPVANAHLMNYLKKVPTALYYYWIKGPNGKALSSFLFTVAAEHPDNLKELFGQKIINAVSLPPNTYPPGLTFAVTSFEKKISVSVLYFDNVLMEDEVQLLESDINNLFVE